MHPVASIFSETCPSRFTLANPDTRPVCGFRLDQWGKMEIDRRFSGGSWGFAPKQWLTTNASLRQVALRCPAEPPSPPSFLHLSPPQNISCVWLYFHSQVIFSFPSLTPSMFPAAVLQQREVRSRALRRLPEELRVGFFKNHHHAGNAQLWPERHLQCGPDRDHVACQPRHRCRWVSSALRRSKFLLDFYH